MAKIKYRRGKDRTDGTEKEEIRKEGRKDGAKGKRAK